MTEARVIGTFRLDPSGAMEDATQLCGKRYPDEQVLAFGRFLGCESPNLQMLKAGASASLPSPIERRLKQETPE